MPERQEGRGGGRRGRRRRRPRVDQVQISISRPSERAGKRRRENDDVMYAAEAKFYLGQLAGFGLAGLGSNGTNLIKSRLACFVGRFWSPPLTQATLVRILLTNPSQLPRRRRKSEEVSHPSTSFSSLLSSTSNFFCPLTQHPLSIRSASPSSPSSPSLLLFSPLSSSETSSA